MTMTMMKTNIEHLTRDWHTFRGLASFHFFHIDDVYYYIRYHHYDADEYQLFAVRSIMEQAL